MIYHYICSILYYICSILYYICGFLRIPYTVIRDSLVQTPKTSAYALKTVLVLAHFIHLAMFFLPELLLVSNNLMISSWLNLWGCTFTTCMTKVTGAGDKTCLLNSLPKSALCSNTWQTNSNLKQKWKTIESLVIIATEDWLTLMKHQCMAVFSIFMY